MVRRLSAALVAWLAAALAAAVALAVPDSDQPRSVGLFVLAALLGGIGVLSAVRGLLHRRRGRRAAVAAAAVTLGRLEYLEPITTRAPLLRWRGDALPVGLRGRVAASPAPTEAFLRGSAQSPRASLLRARPDRAPASSTTRPRTDVAGEGHRGR